VVVVVVSVVVSVVMFVVVFVVVSVVDVVVVAAVVIDIDVGASGIGVDLISAVARGGVVESVVVVPVALETVADTTIAGDVVIAQRVDVVTAVNNIDAEEVIDNVSVDLAHAVGIDAVVDEVVLADAHTVADTVDTFDIDDFVVDNVEAVKRSSVVCNVGLLVKAKEVVNTVLIEENAAEAS
jgi:hypothetical protein